MPGRGPRQEQLTAETAGFDRHLPPSLSRQSYAAGLGALYAYESQFPGVASAKIEGLINRYGIVEEETLVSSKSTKVRTSSIAQSAASCSIASTLTTARKLLRRAKNLPVRCGTSCRASKPG